MGTHTTAYCKMKWTCLICGERHHYLLHKEGTQQNSKYNPAFSSAASTLHKTVYSAHSKANAETSSVILLGTLEVGASHPEGIPQICRVFVDPGSESHFVSEECVQRLGLQRKKVNVKVTGIG